jgi:nitrate reductase delta subunit
MNDLEKKQWFGVVAVLLDYPGVPTFRNQLEEAWEWAEHLAPSPAKDHLLTGLDQMLSTPPEILESLYVNTFDFSQKASLHLTAHELGDSRDRGGALLEIREILRQSGYEETGNELPDYLPLLFEWLSVKPDDMNTGRLESRISAACFKILDHLGDAEPYSSLLRAAAELLPEPGSRREEPKPFGEQGTDADEMPYPIHY